MKWNQQRDKPFNLPVYFANLIITGLLLTCMMCTQMSFAQQQQTYYCFSYYKILPGKEHELRKLIETVDAKVQQNRVNSRAISSWYLYELFSPIGSSAEYDYVVITTTNRFKKSFESNYAFDSALKKTFPGKDAKFFADYYSRKNETWRLVKQEVYAGIAVADSSFPGGSQLKYIVVDFMQPKPGMGAQYFKTETDTFRLIHKKRVKLDDISQWAFLQLAFPYDTKTGYSYLALNFYKDLDRMFGNAKYEEGLKATFPNVALSDLFQSAVAARDNPRAELLRLVLYALPAKQ
ncbi:MAG TPA: hypothetical protein VFO37_15450 [Chitinophagaceae bacterium]|nr:hypothetical protein [Chitinophagaceae bacterium]